jgi:hypothetical protein
MTAWRYMDYAEQIKTVTHGNSFTYFEYLKLKRKPPKVKTKPETKQLPMVTISHFKKKEVKNNMKNEQDATNLFDSIRAEAVKKREARLEQQQKTAEFFARMKKGDDSLEKINQILKGENK